MTIGLFAAAVGLEANAQSPPERYQPSRPTVSPYLNLFRNNNGPLPNYYSLVRPQLQQIDNQRRQQAINTQQQTQIQNLNRGLLQISSPQIAPTGGGSTFRNYSHFYPAMRR